MSDGNIEMLEILDQLSEADLIQDHQEELNDANDEQLMDVEPNQIDDLNVNNDDKIDLLSEKEKDEANGDNIVTKNDDKKDVVIDVESIPTFIDQTTQTYTIGRGARHIQELFNPPEKETNEDQNQLSIQSNKRHHYDIHRLEDSNATFRSQAGDLISSFPFNHISENDSTVQSTQRSIYPFLNLQKLNSPKKKQEQETPELKLNPRMKKMLAWFRQYQIYNEFEDYWKSLMKKHFRKPNILITVIMALVAGLISSVIVFAFESIMSLFLNIFWTIIPHAIFKDQYSSATIAYIYIVPVLMSFFLGLILTLLGNPGDLPDVVHRVHEKGYLSLKKIPSLFLGAIFSITAGASLGPEAPILATCSAVAGWISRFIFLQKDNHIVRGMTLMAMAGAFAALFKVPLGGSLFALEVLHRSGFEFYEFTSYCILSGTFSYFMVLVFSNSNITPLWNFKDDPVGFPDSINTIHLLISLAIGLIASGIAFFFKYLHFRLKLLFQYLKVPIIVKSVLGGIIIATICSLLPPVMFFSEYQAITIADSSVPLYFIFPPTGIWPADNYFFNVKTNAWSQTWWLLLIVGLVKLFMVSVSIHFDFRGGFIFPFIFTGFSLGKSLSLFLLMFSNQSNQLNVYFSPILVSSCMAASLLTCLLRTPIATTIIISSLVYSKNMGQMAILVPVMVSSFTGLFVSNKLRFITTQRSRKEQIFWRKADEDFWKAL